MESDFSIDVGPARDSVAIMLSGFFDIAAIARFKSALENAQACLRTAPNRHLTLVDIRQMKIQSQESVAAFQTVMEAPALRGRRIAFVVADSLARMQLKRIAAGRDEAGFFKDMAEAETWLHESGPG